MPPTIIRETGVSAVFNMNYADDYFAMQDRQRGLASPTLLTKVLLSIVLLLFLWIISTPVRETIGSWLGEPTKHELTVKNVQLENDVKVAVDVNKNNEAEQVKVEKAAEVAKVIIQKETKAVQEYKKTQVVKSQQTAARIEVIESSVELTEKQKHDAVAAEVIESVWQAYYDAKQGVIHEKI